MHFEYYLKVSLPSATFHYNPSIYTMPKTAKTNKNCTVIEFLGFQFVLSPKDGSFLLKSVAKGKKYNSLHQTAVVTKTCDNLIDTVHIVKVHFFCFNFYRMVRCNLIYMRCNSMTH